MSNHTPTETVRRIVEKSLHPPGLYLYGFADLTGLVDQSFGDFRYGISIGQKLDRRIVDAIHNGPTSEYYNHYKVTNESLTRLSIHISGELHQKGIDAVCVEPTVSTDQLDTRYNPDLRTRLSHKQVATRAGMGWIGKTALLVTREFGPRLRLVTILVREQLVPTTAPQDSSKCGKCNICVEACPAGAASGQLWNTSLDRDDFFDAWRCRAMCREYGKRLLGGNARICGICVSVCPIGNSSRK